MKTRIKCFLLFCLSVCIGFAQKSLEVEVTNPLTKDRTYIPVVIPLNQFDTPVQSASVSYKGKEIPYQLDDLNKDGVYDELCFMTDISQKSSKKFTVKLYNKGTPRTYPPQVYAMMQLGNKNIQELNKQDLHISSLTVDKGVNVYNAVHPHGPAFESELVAFRIYFDDRQTIDIYGKKHRGLELEQTQFYPNKEQKAAGLGDDVLWVGNTLGLGTLRGWNGKEPQMISDIGHRTMSILSKGPLRTIVEVIDEHWKADANLPPITMSTRYTLYAGHRDCEVDINFNRPVADYRFVTGIINVKNSIEYQDGKGLRGCWGTDWPAGSNNTEGYKQETVGLGIHIRKGYLIEHLPANQENYAFVVSSPTDHIQYHIAFCSDNEDCGFHSADEWFRYLEAWKEELTAPVSVNY